MGEWIPIVVPIQYPIYGQASGVPSPPPPRGGGLACAETGAVGAATGWWGGAGGAARAHTQALRKPYSL